MLLERRAAWISRDDVRFESARQLYNRIHDPKPFVIVRSMDIEVIGRVLRLARDHRVPIAVRGGGHHVGGFGSCDDGLVFDFSPFRRVDLHVASGIVEVQAGALLGDVDEALASHRRVLPLGTVSTTGVAGLTLGGGIGWLIGLHGLTCDNLIGADVVLADGRCVRAEEPAHANLLWAIRGGGGSFGVVTRFRYQSHDLPPFITGSAVVRIASASVALRRLIDFLEQDCPRELTVAPAFVRDRFGEFVLSIDFCLASGDDSVLRQFAKALDCGEWFVEQDRSYVAWQRAFNAAFEPPMRGYWKALYGQTLTCSDFNAMIAALAEAPCERSSILIEHLHGAFKDVGEEHAAFPLRDASFGVLIAARWTHAAEDERAMQWVRRTFERLDPPNSSKTYLNYAFADDIRATASFDGASRRRLLDAKSLYDPSNTFRRNHNIAVTSTLEDSA